MHQGCLQLNVQCEYMPHFVHWKTCGLSSYGVMVQLWLKSFSLAISKSSSLSFLLVRSITMEAKFLVHRVSSFPSQCGMHHCFMSLYPRRYVHISSWIRSMDMGSLLLHHVRTLFILMW